MAKCLPLYGIPFRFEAEEVTRGEANKQVGGWDELPAKILTLFLDGKEDLRGDFTVSLPPCGEHDRVAAVEGRCH